MKVVVKECRSLPCSAEVFTINGNKADEWDFGDSMDAGPATGDEDFDRYCCANCVWRRDAKLKAEAMSKYHLSEDEYNDICTALEDKLSAGLCGWCE